MLHRQVFLVMAALGALPGRTASAQTTGAPAATANDATPQQSSDRMSVPQAADKRSEAASSVSPSRRRRVLGGHAFVPSDIVTEATVTSYAQMATALGFGFGTVEEIEISLAALGVGFDSQVAVAESFALGFAVSGSALTGINDDSALLAGATGTYDVSLRALYRILRLENLALSASFAASRYSDYGIQPVAALNNDNLLTEVTGFRFRPGLRVALGLLPALGILANADFALATESSNVEDADVSTEVDLRAGLSLDLHPNTGVPVAILGILAWNNEFGSDGSSSTQAGFGLFTSGQLDFQIGAEALFELTSDITVVVGRLGMRYYW